MQFVEFIRVTIQILIRFVGRTKSQRHLNQSCDLMVRLNVKDVLSAEFEYQTEQTKVELDNDDD